VPGRSPKKRIGAANGPAAAGGLYASGPIPQDLSGGPANLGKITSSSALADTDPLGVNPNINFDAIGGLGTQVASLKEMTLLPLLYPEVFQRFDVTPPRGVLFHGPPGTGKTLMARALASSCRSDGRSISFFMRKGADCLSKWVGEAERQLRLLFEEAKNSQPSIIFFDEIDGVL
jgi:ATPase family AAA domain-containing protein 2